MGIRKKETHRSSENSTTLHARRARSPGPCRYKINVSVDPEEDKMQRKTESLKG